MVESLTLNYKWTKPELQKSPTTWGKYINDDLDSIDALVFANQQGMVPVGAVTMFAGAAAPANWLLCLGQTLDYSVTPAYQALFNLIKYTYGGSGTQFALPNLQQKFPLGAGPNPLGQVSGTFNYTIAVANLPPHNHPASQDAHAHVIATGGHSHGIATGGHSHGIHTGGHAHSLSQQVMTPNAGGQGAAQAGGWAFQTVTVSSVGDLGGNTDAAGNLGGNTDTAGNLGGNTDTRTPNVYTGNTGSSTPLSIVPPFIAMNFIIRYQ